MVRKKHSLVTRLHLLIGILLSGYTIYVFIWLSQTPYTGFYYRFDTKVGNCKVIVVEPGSPASRAGLEVGDHVLQIDDHEILNLIDAAQIFFRKLKANTSYKLAYKRGDTHYKREFRPTPHVFPYITLIYLLIGLLFLVLAFSAYIKKPLDPSTRIFYLGLVFVFPSPVVINYLQALMTPEMLVLGFFFILFLPLVLHFTLIFSEYKNRVKKYPILIFLNYIPACVYLSAWVLLTVQIRKIYQEKLVDPTVSYYFIILVKAYLGLFLFYMTLAYICVTHTFFTTTSVIVKKQVKWIFWGGAISLFLVFLGFYEILQDVPLFIGGRHTFPFILIISHLNLNLSLLFAIFKYRLMDIDIVINRSVSYFLVSGIILFLYFILFEFFSWIFESLIENSRFATFFASVFVVAFFFRPMLMRVEKWIDRIFDREKYNLHQAMEIFSQALITIRDPEAIFRQIYKIVDESLHVATGALWLPSQPGHDLTLMCLSDGNDLPNHDNKLHLENPLVGYLLKTGKGLTHYQVRYEQRFQIEKKAFSETYRETNMAILLPLTYKQTLLGIIGFGEKRSGDLYTTDEVTMLTMIANQSSVAMENARAYSRIEALNNELEDKVRQVQEQQNEILALQDQLLNENIYLREEIQQNFNFEEIIGSSQAMKNILHMVEKIAPTLSTVLIRGKSGTGKELISRAIHFNSHRKDKPFVKVNCAAIPENLLESEFFGHEKGAFTGAIKSKVGKFELAAGGTIFLDEIGDLDPALQVKLLRVLQEKEFERLGGNRVHQANVRIIAATNRNIEDAIKKGRFREDLFFRLNVISLTLPPLNERKEDIRALSIHFIQKFARQVGKPIKEISPEAMKALRAYDWPGNVRELANVMERAVVLTEGNVLTTVDIPSTLLNQQNILASSLSDPKGLREEMKVLEMKRILAAMDQAKGNKSEAARILGMKRTTLNSKLRRYDGPSL